MKRFATLTVIGRDKTGVVARITNFLFMQKANIEALEEQVTRGQFSMTVQASWRDSELDRETVAAGLEGLARELEMEIKTRFTALARRQRMAVMVTKEPHCFRRLVEAIKSGRLKKAEPALVLSNRRDLEALAWEAGLPFEYVGWGERPKAEQLALRILDQHEVVDVKAAPVHAMRSDQERVVGKPRGECAFGTDHQPLLVAAAHELADLPPEFFLLAGDRPSCAVRGTGHDKNGGCTMHVAHSAISCCPKWLEAPSESTADGQLFAPTHERQVIFVE